MNYKGWETRKNKRDDNVKRFVIITDNGCSAANDLICYQ